MKDNEGVLMPYGGYEKLRAYVVAEAVYDATVVFCNRFIDRRSRTHDQMIQAARSGVRNISEGSGAAATSKRSELKLTNVARASLNDELLCDFKSFLVQNGLRVWDKDASESIAMRSRLRHDHAQSLPPAKPGLPQLTGLAGLSDFVAKAEPEIAANAMLCAVNQAAYLLRRLIEKQSKEFVEQGGFADRTRSLRANSPHGTWKCPACNGPMQERTAKFGPNAGNAFLGCCNYPNCKGTRKKR